MTDLYTKRETIICKTHEHANSTPSLILDSSTWATNAIACQGASGKPTTPTYAGVHVCLDSASAGGIKIPSAHLLYVDCTAPPFEFREPLIYEYRQIPQQPMNCDGMLGANLQQKGD